MICFIRISHKIQVSKSAVRSDLSVYQLLRVYNTMRISASLLCILMAATLAPAYQSRNMLPYISRRAFLQKGPAAVAAVVVVSSVATLARGEAALEDERDNEDMAKKKAAQEKEAAKQKVAQEKAERRLAEETKKRLAVGRIGTI